MSVDIEPKEPQKQEGQSVPQEEKNSQSKSKMRTPGEYKMRPSLENLPEEAQINIEAREQAFGGYFNK